MPELPDVEGFRRLLQSHVVGNEVTAVSGPGMDSGCSWRPFGPGLRAVD